MRWKDNRIRLKRSDKRVVHCFAWLPTTMSDDVTVVWLENYELHQECEPVDVDGRLGWVGRYAHPLRRKS